MKTVVVTGSTRGIGYGLADSFLALGCAVVVSGRTAPGVENAANELSARYETSRVLGHPCDVTRLKQVESLWDSAKARFGQIDIWINNAGISHFRDDCWDHTEEQIRTVVETNLLGTVYGAKVAIRGMLEQGCGSLYNMEGLGSDGRKVKGLALYGTTKFAVRYYTESLVDETSGTPVLVGALRPGMVVTDLLMGEFKERPEDWERARQIFNILADRVETVAPWLARKVLANDKTGARIAWLTRPRVIGRFLTAPFRKRDLFQ